MHHSNLPQRRGVLVNVAEHVSFIINGLHFVAQAESFTAISQQNMV